ncbi:MAG: hypothetical protein QOG10_5259 [Kribbellaceae bacterium]|jgi:hypothetical protein|nr:hypothetical protein [Kribbellaceae bacterium]
MSPQPIDIGGIGDIAMFPDETRAAFRKISESGRPFGARWKVAGPALEHDEQLVNTGFDDLSTTFRKQYNALKPMLVNVADHVQENFERMGTDGNDIVDRYLELTQQQVDRMRSLE